MDFIQGFNRNQLQMLSFDAFVKPDSWARVVDLFVDVLPINALGFKEELANEGRPPYAPADLLKLFLYGYKSQLRSSRKLAHACEVNMEVIWLLKGLRPSARKIAYFRKNNPVAFKQAFRYFVVMLKEMNLIDGETIAIDSFKIRAQNALKNNFNQKKIDRHLEYIDGKIDDYQRQIEQEDSADEKQKIEAKIIYQNKKKDNYKRIEKQLEDTGEAQISLTDPDAKSVILHRNIVNVGYNVQAGCDSKYRLFVNNDTGTVNDTHALSPMALDAKELLGLEKMKTLKDKGYTTGKHIDICAKNNITTYSSPKENASMKKGLFDLKTFIYDKENDHYTCPANEFLKTNGVNTKLETINKFVDGASVQKVGDLNFNICRDNLDDMVTVHEGKVCQSILDLYNKNAIVVEPAGALTTAVLEQFQSEIKGKNVVCLISGSNNDITRTEEIKERALLHSGHKHYFIVRFPLRAGALREFLTDILGPNDYITHFEYSKKHNRNSGPAVVGLELDNPNDIDNLIQKMKAKNFFGEYLNDRPDLFELLAY